MKHRNSFVSNSSSASFVIARKDITEDQFIKIQNYQEEAKKLNMECIDNFWEISWDNEYIYGSTLMDNFEFDTFLSNIEVDMSKVILSGENFDRDMFDDLDHLF